MQPSASRVQGWGAVGRCMKQSIKEGLEEYTKVEVEAHKPQSRHSGHFAEGLSTVGIGG